MNSLNIIELINDFLITHKVEAVKIGVLLAIILPFVILYPLLSIAQKILLQQYKGRRANFFMAVGFPIRLFLVKSSIFLLLHIVASFFKFPLPHWTDKFQWFIGFSIFILGFWRIINFLEISIIEKGKDPTLAQVTSNLLKIILSFVFLLGLLQFSGTSLSGLLAFGGMGGLVVGMASKDLLANIFGSIMIFMDRPFKVGDWISSPDRNIEGIVEKIGLRITQIRNFDKRPVYIPNSVFSNIIVENPTRMNFRRINERIGIRHEDADKIEKIIDEIQAMLNEHPDIINDESPTIHFDSFSLNSLDMVLNAHCTKTNKVEFQAVKQKILLKAIEIIHHNGAKCAKPVSNINLSKEVGC